MCLIYGKASSFVDTDTDDTDTDRTGRRNRHFFGWYHKDQKLGLKTPNLALACLRVVWYTPGIRRGWATTTTYRHHANNTD